MAFIVYVAKEDCVARIMEYAGYANEDIHAFRTALKEQNTKEIASVKSGS